MMHNHDFPTGYGRKKRVDMDGRVFFVGVFEDGRPRNICERRVRADGVITSHTYWHHSKTMGRFGRGPRTKTGRTIIMDILIRAGVDPRFIAGH